MVKRVVQYVTRGIWEKSEEEYSSKRVRWFVRQFKIFIVTLRGFYEHDLFVRSAALTFYTLMSLVPIAALVFGVVKGFGMDQQLIDYLYAEFPQYNQMIGWVLEFAEKQLLRTRGGVVAISGFVVLIWAVVRVFSNIEAVFNHIWEVRRNRNIGRMFSDYIAVVFLAPILWITSDSLILYIKTKISNLTSSPLIEYGFGFASLAAIWIMFAFIYALIPNTKVNLRSAIMSGIITGTIFQAFQIIYFYVQGEVSAYNAIYGSFAAIPLFMIWLQTSWQILFFGAELSFAFQNVKRYEQEQLTQHISYDNKRKIIVSVMVVVARQYLLGRGAVTSESIGNELNLPLRIVREVIFELERAGLVLSVQSDDNKRVNNYVPAKDVHKLTIYDIINEVECKGEFDIDFSDNEEMTRIAHVVDSLKIHSLRAPQNILLTDVINL